MYRTTLITVSTLTLILLGFGCAAQLPSIDTNTLSPTPDLTSYPWFYLRDNKLLAPGENPVSIITVGDIFPGRDSDGTVDPLQDVANWLGNADLTIGNLEGVLVDSGTPRQAPEGGAQPIILRAPPAFAERLSQAGFDIVSLANNHSLDYGTEGLQGTIDHLQQAGLAVTGVTDDAPSTGPLIQEIDGLCLAFLAFNAVSTPADTATCAAPGGCSTAPRLWDPQTSPPIIAAAGDQADAVIVSVHWGYEYQPQPDPVQESIARAMIAAGADLIIGHHPHVPQKFAIQGDQVIAYSLGNFLFDQRQGNTQNGLTLRAFFDDQGLRAVQALPLRAGLQPHLLPITGAKPWLSQYLPAENRLGYACTQNGCVPTDAPPATTSSTFFSGQIDLTGDGLPETIRRQGEQITIYEQGTAVWQSPTAWRVVDVALGDPNDDGRYEIMLAIWQKDADGYERSQPYIIGHRRGRYDLLWGGRPVADPILELAVGDVDGDGSNELVVIEELAGGSAQALSVWRWAGWTFSHVWRSEIGAYSDLFLVGENQPLISVVANAH